MYSESKNEEFVPTIKVDRTMLNEIDRTVETMGDWLKLLRNNELNEWHKIAIKKQEERTTLEENLIFSYSMALYGIEMSITEFPVTENHLGNLMKQFINNIDIEKKRRDGLCVVEGEYSIIRDKTKITLTNKGIKELEEYLGHNDINDMI